MTSAGAYARLQKLGAPVVETAAAAAALRLSPGAANKVLGRLARAGLVRHVFHGLWTIGDICDPLLLPDHVTAPFPSYVSLQTALHHHGLISQIPVVIYAVTSGRARRVRTQFGTCSIHHVAPELFDGFEISPSGVKMATPEKALFDILYLSGKRTREFSALPEIEFPRGFRWKVVRQWLDRITFARDRTMIQRRLERLAPLALRRA